MTAKKLIKTKATGTKAPKDAPQLFRLNLEVGDLKSAIAFYTKLLGVRGRKQAGSRCYFETGPVTLQVVDVSASHAPQPTPKALYFTVKNLEAVHARAKDLNCFLDGAVHDELAGDIVVRPWGERSFYIQDRWRNPLCFVEAGTVYAG
jgi:catechol-2,3-dioxygenase